MKANELRIGNYVKYSDFASAKKSEIVMVDISDLILLKNMVEGCFYDPIPLTPEILVKAGFEETYNSRFRVKFDHITHGEIGYTFSDIENYYGKGFRYYDHHIDIKYVHQLQNLYFALTGEELPIEL